MARRWGPPALYWRPVRHILEGRGGIAGFIARMDWESPEQLGVFLAEDVTRYRGLSLGGGDVTDVLVRDVPEHVVAALDARASRLGLSRSEYLRRRLAQEAVTDPQPVTVKHLAAFAETFTDLTDPEVMKGAWE